MTCGGKKRKNKCFDLNSGQMACNSERRRGRGRKRGMEEKEKRQFLFESLSCQGEANAVNQIITFLVKNGMKMSSAALRHFRIIKIN